MESQRSDAIDVTQEVKPNRHRKIVRSLAAATVGMLAAASAVAVEAKTSHHNSTRMMAVTEAPNQPSLALEELQARKAARLKAVKAQEEHDKNVQRLLDVKHLMNVTALNKAKQARQSTPHATHISLSDSVFLACTRGHESDTAGGYQAVSPDGLYYGAYQFLRSTWNSVAQQVGRTDLIGVNPAQASPQDQDALATDLYHMQGTAPWGGRC